MLLTETIAGVGLARALSAALTPWLPRLAVPADFSLPAQLTRHARRLVLHLPAQTPWAGLVTGGIT